MAAIESKRESDDSGNSDTTGLKLWYEDWYKCYDSSSIVVVK